MFKFIYNLFFMAANAESIDKVVDKVNPDIILNAGDKSSYFASTPFVVACILSACILIVVLRLYIAGRNAKNIKDSIDE